MSLLREPTRRERATMEKYYLTSPCLYAAEGGGAVGSTPTALYVPWELHSMCPGTFVRDLYASPDDWQQCRCPCHAGQPHAGRGNVVLKKLPPILPGRH